MGPQLRPIALAALFAASVGCHPGDAGNRYGGPSFVPPVSQTRPLPEISCTTLSSVVTDAMVPSLTIPREAPLDRVAECFPSARRISIAISGRHDLPVLASFKHLEWLSIDPVPSTTECAALTEVEPMPSVEELVFKSNCSTDMGKLLAKLPSLRRVQLLDGNTTTLIEATEEEISVSSFASPPQRNFFDAVLQRFPKVTRVEVDAQMPLDALAKLERLTHLTAPHEPLASVRLPTLRSLTLSRCGSPVPKKTLDAFSHIRGLELRCDVAEGDDFTFASLDTLRIEGPFGKSPLLRFRSAPIRNLAIATNVAANDLALFPLLRRLELKGELQPGTPVLPLNALEELFLEQARSLAFLAHTPSLRSLEMKAVFRLGKALAPSTSVRVLKVGSTNDLAFVSTFPQVRELSIGLFPRGDLKPLLELKHLERLTLVGPQVADWTLTPDLGAVAKLRVKSLELVRCFRGDELAPKIAKSVSTTGCTLRH